MFYLAAVERESRVFTLLRSAPLLFSQHVSHLVFIDVLRQIPLLYLCLVLLLTKQTTSAIRPSPTISNIQSLGSSYLA